jgi:hypothetical protein
MIGKKDGKKDVIKYTDLLIGEMAELNGVSEQTLMMFMKG